LIGKRIKSFRIDNGYKTKEFADIIGITQGALSGLENEKSKPSAETLESLVRHTNINPKWLLTGEDDTNYQPDSPVDTKFLQEIIAGVEEGLLKNNLSLRPEKKAELISLLYEQFDEKRKIEKGTIKKYLKLVA
jgi:transcriptional regulator with XRE-family HTH domain